MKYLVLTLFPEICDSYFASSIMAKAVSRGIVEYKAVNIRDFAFDKHQSCDDAPYGGGPGMLMLPEPLGYALESVGVKKKERKGIGCGEWGVGNEERKSSLPTPYSPYTVYLSPSGRPFDQSVARELASKEELVLVCGRYEGIDQRIIDLYTDDEISVGDYVLSSGEVAALVLIDATYRLLEQVINHASLEEESFDRLLLEYPQYTRPEIYDTIKVPEVLLSGHHENIRRWRLEKRVEKTIALRPDLIQRGISPVCTEGSSSGKEPLLYDDEVLKIIEQKYRQMSGKGDM